MKRTLSLLSALAIVLSGDPASAQSKTHKKAIRAIESGTKNSERDDGKLSIEKLLERRRVPGVSIAVIHDFEVVWARGYGMARKDVKVSPTTTFQAGSVSKPVAALAALIAVEQGKFGLDDPINTLLKSWQLPENTLTAERAVTPRMLLSHTGGTTVHGFPGYDPNGEIPTLPQLLSGIGPANTTPVIVDLPPFTEWRYSGGGTTIMQLAMEDLHNEEFEDILARTVLEPSNMTNSTFDQPMHISDAPNAAFAHGGKSKIPWHIYPEQAAAGLWSTPTDLAKFAITVQKALRGDEDSKISEDIAKKMVTPTDVGGGYGLGFNVTTRGLYFGHGGSDWGFISLLRVHKTKGYGIAIMTNGQAGGRITNELMVRVAEAYDWDRSKT